MKRNGLLLSALVLAVFMMLSTLVGMIRIRIDPHKRKPETILKGVKVRDQN